MSRFVRQSKVRHVYGECAKSQNQFTDAKLSPLAGDQQHIKANEKYVAAPLSNRRGSVAILDKNNAQKLPAQLPLLDGHKGKTIDFDFCPFNSDLIATCGDDGVIKCWKIPEEGLTKTTTESNTDLLGHIKKITVLKHHPTALGVLASGSADSCVKVWDVCNGELSYSVSLSNSIQDIVWNYSGSLLAACSKDKLVSLIDPRKDKTVASFEAHSGSKPFKSLFLGNSFNLLTVGSSKNSNRSFKIWDQRVLSKPLCENKFDQSSGTLLPFFDEDLNILYFGGKGENSVRYFETVESSPYQYQIGNFRTTKPTKGICMLEKRHCDVMKHQVGVFLRLTTDSIEPLVFYCPRKSETFLKDIYPDSYSGVASCSCDEYFGNKEKEFVPLLSSLNPTHKSKTKSSLKVMEKSKSKREVLKELELAKQFIKSLSERLEKLGEKVEWPRELKKEE